MTDVTKQQDREHSRLHHRTASVLPASLNALTGARMLRARNARGRARAIRRPQGHGIGRALSVRHGSVWKVSPGWARLARHRPRAVAMYGRMSYNGGMGKTERIELRISAEDKDAITAAAAMEHTTTTEFVRHAVLDRVQHVQARSDRTLMPAEQFDALVTALDIADDVPNLARAFARPRRFVAR